MIEDIASTLLDIIDLNNVKEEETRYVFLDENGNPNKKAREIGLYIHKTGGDKLMHMVMNYIMEKVLKDIEDGDDWKIYDLRQLEVCWNGIGEWQA
jgi:hypothetical protein